MPLVTVIIAYAIASGVIKVFADAGMQVTSISTSLLLVLMFGAGTDYCLLLVARYVEELHQHEDKHDAIRTAIPRVGPAIIASAFTVSLAMLVLVFAELASTRTVGPVNAVGILIVMAASLTLLPAILAIVSRTATAGGRVSDDGSPAARGSPSPRSPRSSSSARSGSRSTARRRRCSAPSATRPRAPTATTR
jgi:uncharacterized membrane protein YdfJ with MMPL/SSD domain